MKKLTSLLLAAAVLPNAFAADKAPKDTVAGFVFTDVITIPTTSVKDQNKSGTCWCFSATSFIEDEILRKGGDSLHLSEMYTVRQCYLDKAERFIRLYGETNFAAGGSAADVPYVIAKYGAMPESAYPGIAYGEDKHVHGELDAALAAYLKAVVRKPNRRLSTSWKNGVEAILDAYLGPVPETFTVDGKTYTPKTYAESLPINTDDYVGITSFTHHPYYKSFAVEVPDNWLWEQYYNVTLEEMKEIVDNALKNGYPVAWGADVSEGGFHWADGYANMPKGKSQNDMDGTELSRWVKLSDSEKENGKYKVKGPVEEITVTPEIRQEMFDRQETTDDHGMEIVGIAKDQDGNQFYKVKNSWDDNQVYNGYFYVSVPYFLAKTMDIYVNKEAIPSATAKKLGL